MTDEEHQQQAAQHQQRMGDIAQADAARRQAAARAELVADIEALRRTGVKVFKGQGIDVEFFPAEQKPQPAPAKQPDPELCACGHPEGRSHMNGLCVEGCTEEQCKPKAVK
jgi:hypothetical protein